MRTNLRNHPRYGNLLRIWHETGCRCHLCGERVDIHTYGENDADSATFDHLLPQLFGGTDDDGLIAHRGCNSSRGIEDVQDARLRLSGRTDAPLSTTAKVAAGAAASLGVGAVVGSAASHEDGSFNWGAAAVGTTVTAAVLAIAFS